MKHLIALLFLTVFVLPTFAEDVKTYPGAACLSQTDGSVSRIDGKLVRTSPSGDTTVICPLVRDIMAGSQTGVYNPLAGGYNLKNYIRVKPAWGHKITCTFYSKTPSGGFAGIVKRTSPKGNNQDSFKLYGFDQQIPALNLATFSEKDGHYYYECKLAHNDEIISYGLSEVPQQFNNILINVNGLN